MYCLLQEAPFSFGFEGRPGKGKGEERTFGLIVPSTLSVSCVCLGDVLRPAEEGPSRWIEEEDKKGELQANG